MSKPVIIKVQRQIYGDSPSIFLCYEQTRQHTTMQEIKDDTKKALGRDAKGYFEALFDEVKNVWLIGKRVSDKGF